VCTTCGRTVGGAGGGFAGPGQKDKTAAGLLGIFLGAFGVHKFYLGRTTPAVIMLVVTLVGSLVIVGPVVMGIIGLIEGIIYLTKSDQDFYTEYVVNEKDWF
jgi:TM2 domain-containing membrane protein YozV